MIQTSMKLGGVEALVRRVEEVGRDRLGKLREGMEQAAQIIFDKSQEYVPVDTGVLKATGKIVETSSSSTHFQFSVSYGRAVAPYAVFVHEMVQIPHDPPTRSKYLEAAVKETREQCSRAVRLAMKGR